jgi:predicted Zn-dependent protease
LLVQLASLLLPLRRTLHLLSQYKARDALGALAQLPAAQLGSAGVLLLIGRCQYELVDYARAAEAFEAARAADPLSLEVRLMLCCWLIFICCADCTSG